jgi:hypothetical protein
MAYKGERSGGGEYQIHPEGNYDGIVYAFRDMGEKENQFGNVERRCYFAIESLDEFMEDGKPFAGFVFFNMKWGNPEATGKMRPIMQQVREVLLGRKLKDGSKGKADGVLPEETWYDFEESNYLGTRVRYRVTHNESRNGKTYANTEILERLKDQKQGEMYNESQIIKDDEPEDTKKDDPDEDLPF